MMGPTKRFPPKRLWMIPLLAGGLSALALSWALAAPRPAFLHVATNLSNRPARLSYYPDIAASPDGNRVVAVWPEAYQDGEVVLKGSVYLRWASENTGIGWSAPVTIHAGNSNECAHWAAVAVTGTNPYTAHVAYVTKEPCDGPTKHYIRHRTCVLGGDCSPPEKVVTATLSPGDAGIGSVDIALDGEGRPHFVYAYHSNVGTIYYLSPGGQRETVSSGDARTPAIAWGDGAVHIVWATEPLAGEYFAYYRRIGRSPQVLNQNYPRSDAPHPAVAVFSRTVFVVWDMNKDCGSDQTQCEYTLAYIRSTDGGLTWPLYEGNPKWFEVGGEVMGTSIPYTSTRAAEEYIPFLRPSVGFRADGKPVVVWHVNRGTVENPDYDLYYTQALTVPEDAGGAIEWAEIGPYGQNPSGNSASPVVAPFLASETVHVVYLQRVGGDWETYYDGNEYQNYPHVYLPLVMRNAP